MAATSVNMISVADLARQEGITRQGAYQRIKKAGIPLQGGLVDRDVAAALMAKRIRPRINGQRRDAAPVARDAADLDDDRVSYDEARRRREKAEAELAELKLAELRGDLVRKADVKAAMARKVASLREAFLQMPARLVPRLAADPSPSRMDAMLREEITLALQQVSEG